MKLYSGIDLHSNNSVVTILDEEDRVVAERRVANELELIHGLLAPYSDALVGVVVESTYNWYWLVDGLMEHGLKVHLANTAAIQQYSGFKHTDDRHDARWLAHLLRLGLLKEGYIYPRQERAIRDLARKRIQLVQQRTTNILSVQNLVARETGRSISANELKKLVAARNPWPEESPLGLAIGSHLSVLRALEAQISRLEEAILLRANPREEYRALLSVSGVGKILGFTILLETGDVRRFAGPGNFASYSRCVNSRRLSNGKKKGRNNTKNGNRYLAWAFVEAANFAIRHYPPVKRFYERKKAKRNAVVAIKAVAHKLARASYYVMRDRVPFDMDKAFG
ncbi:IS110 family transposase [Thiohalomonas denitrificans]|uniref:IS110 family transposase n=1 Tax=Thiohalomonas denitrificans TaxID=415747 RepID=UPI0026F13A9C|nr:IS110 family transposase [Thiohalomonas denitrificans]